MKNRYNSNKSILVSTYIFLMMILGLIGYIIYFNVVEADDVINNTYNKRQYILSEKITRGSIYSADGEILAETQINDDGTETRNYPYSNLFAHVVGYLDNGGFGIESSAAYYMLTSNINMLDQITNDLTGEKNPGDNVITTLNYSLQNAAYNALGDNIGAVIILEPSTGKLLTLVSKPDFNPNTLTEDWTTIISNDDGSSVLLDRATQGLYPPGSTFKIVTLLEYIRENPDTYQDYTYNCDGAYELSDGLSIGCSHNIAHGVQDTLLSFANSCNGSFITMGLTLDIESYKKTAEDLLFNSNLPITLEYNQSQFVLEKGDSEWDIAQTAFGQGETLITPMHLALIGSAIANDGVLMTPYLVDYIESVDGNIVKSFEQNEFKSLITKEEASVLQTHMEAVIDTSFTWLFGESQYTVAGKSGTAQYGTEGYEHSLFISYSPIEEPEIVVAVVLEGGVQRQTSAAEVAKVIYDTYYAEVDY